ncbi:hypothetical protein AB4059_15925 [Lysobacter sp. 2RAF19]
MIDSAIVAFINVLNASWRALAEEEARGTQEGLLWDWSQANWEVLVEASLNIRSGGLRLSVYGEGADCRGGSSRFSFPDDLPTHEVRCQPAHALVIDALSGAQVRVVDGGYALDRFVSVHGGWYFDRPPFNHALIEIDGKQCALPVDELNWSLAKLQ